MPPVMHNIWASGIIIFYLKFLWCMSCTIPCRTVYFCYWFSGYCYQGNHLFLKSRQICFFHQTLLMTFLSQCRLSCSLFLTFFNSFVICQVLANLLFPFGRTDITKVWFDICDHKARTSICIWSWDSYCSL